MNRKLILGLSMFGLFMSIATVYFIPSKIEPICWGAIMAMCALAIAKQAPGKYFLHGFYVCLLNCVYITTMHIILFDTYVANHAEEMAMMKGMPMADSPKLLMALTGPVIGIVTGIILGLLSMGAAKLFNKK